MLTKLLFLAALTMAAVDVPAQDAPRRYAAGQFPDGKIYQESDLAGLVGTALPDASYLVGRFVYLGLINGQRVFSSFAPGPNNADAITFGKALIDVAFFGNVPRGLAVGKVIVATPAEPLTIKRVTRSANGALLLVAAESWSLPSPDNKAEK
jgi:hypothetical protein